MPIFLCILEKVKVDALLKNMQELPISRTLAIRPYRNDLYKISLHKRTFQLARVDILDLTFEFAKVDITSNEIYGCASEIGHNAKKHLLPQMLA